MQDTVTILHIGSGCGTEWLDKGIPAEVGRIVLVEPNPACFPDLMALAAADPRVEIVKAAVTVARDHPVKLHVLSLEDWSCLANPAPLRQFMPGLAVVEHLDVAGVSLPRLLADLALTGDNNHLILDAMGEEGALLATLLKSYAAERFSRIELRAPRHKLWPTGGDIQTVTAQMTEHGFALQPEAGEADPDLPRLAFHRDPVQRQIAAMAAAHAAALQDMAAQHAAAEQMQGLIRAELEAAVSLARKELGAVIEDRSLLQATLVAEQQARADLSRQLAQQSETLAQTLLLQEGMAANFAETEAAREAMAVQLADTSAALTEVRTALVRAQAVQDELEAAVSLTRKELGAVFEDRSLLQATLAAEQQARADLSRQLAQQSETLAQTLLLQEAMTANFAETEAALAQVQAEAEAARKAGAAQLAEKAAALTATEAALAQARAEAETARKAGAAQLAEKATALTATETALAQARDETKAARAEAEAARKAGAAQLAEKTAALTAAERSRGQLQTALQTVQGEVLRQAAMQVSLRADHAALQSSAQADRAKAQADLSAATAARQTLEQTHAELQAAYAALQADYTALQSGAQADRIKALADLSAATAAHQKLEQSHAELTAARAAATETAAALRETAEKLEQKLSAAQSDLGLALRMQAVASADLQDLQARYTTVLTRKEAQDRLIAQLVVRLEEASEHLQQMPAPGAMSAPAVMPPEPPPVSIRPAAKGASKPRSSGKRQGSST